MAEVSSCAISRNFLYKNKWILVDYYYMALLKQNFREITQLWTIVLIYCKQYEFRADFKIFCFFPINSTRNSLVPPSSGLCSKQGSLYSKQGSTKKSHLRKVRLPSDSSKNSSFGFSMRSKEVNYSVVQIYFKTGTNTDFRCESRQHLNFQILRKRRYLNQTIFSNP